MYKYDPIAITAFDCLCAGGRGQAAFESMLKLDRPQLMPGKTLDEQALDYPFFGLDRLRIPGGSAKESLNLALEFVGSVFKQADLPQGKRGGIVMGTTSGSSLHFLRGYQALSKQEPLVSKDIEEFFTSNLALYLAEKYGLSLPLNLVNACTSGADALGMAVDLLRLDQADFIICGGADALSLVAHSGFARLMIYSTEPCCPYDALRQGLNLGEGVACLVLEPLAKAKGRRAKILGYIRGYGCAADAHHLTAPHPAARGLRQAVARALLEADIDFSDLAFINVHGTSTLENDKIEGAFLSSLAPLPLIWGSKGSTGHTLGAAGALEAIFSLQALNAGIVPKSHGFAQADPQIGINLTTVATAINKKYALSLSLGFG